MPFLSCGKGKMTFAEDLQKQGITVLKTIPEKAEGEVRMTVFCGSAYGNMPIFREIAEDMGKYCAENNLTVMCGGGRFGMMGALIRSTLENGGKVVAASIDTQVQDQLISETLKEMGENTWLS